mmetsp:Transcript_45927/g.33675  ORF Transcript_45927/g.33675 Transcript_45927/m.33675 type:complete len:140 (-) Transcript_45927:1297-1716(-)
MSYEKKFINEPSEVEHAFNYFRELNRHGKYHTVLRLFNKHEMVLSYKRQSPFYEKIMEQVDYARENIESLKKAVDASKKSKAEEDNYTSIIVSKGFDLAKRLLYVAATFLIFSLIFRNFDNKSFYENYKFEIKKATEVH